MDFRILHTGLLNKYNLGIYIETYKFIITPAPKVIPNYKQRENKLDNCIIELSALFCLSTTVFMLYITEALKKFLEFISQKGDGLRNWIQTKTIWIYLLVLIQMLCVILGKSINYYGPQKSSCKTRTRNFLIPSGLLQLFKTFSNSSYYPWIFFSPLGNVESLQSS